MMIRPLLLAGAAMMTLPALAQTTGTTSTTNSGTAPPITEGVAASNVRDDTAPNMAPGQVPTGDAADETDVVTTDPTVQAGQTGTASTTGTTMDHSPMDQSTMSSSGTNAQTDTMSSQTGTMSSTDTGTTAAADTGAWNGMAGQRMSWNFAGNMGEFGSPDWGVDVMRTAYAPRASANMSAATQTGASAGIGGPEDIDANWATYAKSGAMLTPLEFGTWVLDAHGHNVTQQTANMDDSRGANNPHTQILNVTAGALAAADMNGDWRVSREELASFMGA